MSERNYYVICDDNCKFEGMTKEQIYDAIADATGNTPTPVDQAFITKIKEQNANHNLKVWKGTEAQYNALDEKDNDTIYIVGGNKLADASVLDNFADFIVEQGTSDGWKYRKWSSGKIECWKTETINNVETPTAIGSMFYEVYYPLFTVPSNVLNVDNVQLTLTASLAVLFMSREYRTNPKNIGVNIIAPIKYERDSYNRKAIIDAYVTGTWK